MFTTHHPGHVHRTRGGGTEIEGEGGKGRLHSVKWYIEKGYRLELYLEHKEYIQVTLMTMSGDQRA